MKDEEVVLPGRLQDAPTGFHGALQEGNVVAEAGSKAAGLQEVDLHVDHDHCGCCQIQNSRVGLHGQRDGAVARCHGEWWSLLS